MPRRDLARNGLPDRVPFRRPDWPSDRPVGHSAFRIRLPAADGRRTRTRLQPEPTGANRSPVGTDRGRTGRSPSRRRLSATARTGRAVGTYRLLDCVCLVFGFGFVVRPFRCRYDSRPSCFE